MEWWQRLGAMYQFFNSTPALANDMAFRGPSGDFAYDMANTLATGPTPIDVYPADQQTLEG